MDVTDYMCSGRHSCSMRVPNTMLDAKELCPEDFKSFLEADYECMSGELLLYILYKIYKGPDHKWTVCPPS